MNTTIVQLKVPSVGESVTEVEIAEWHKQAGDTVARDENLVVLETDKATLEVPSPVAGRLTKVLKQNGDRVKVGEVLGEIEAGDIATPVKPDVGEAAAAAGSVKVEEKASVAPAAPASPAVPGVPVSPAVALPDVEERELAPAVPAPSVTAAEPMAPAKAMAGDRDEEVVPMSLLRRKIGERLVAARQTAALLTTFNEIDMTEALALRKANQARFQERYQIKLGLMSFFVRATVAALQEVPQLNAEIRGANIVYHRRHDLAIAIGGGRGLVVPVLRDAGRMNFAQIEQGIADFAQRVMENKIRPDELLGGTFTITNGGIYGSLLSTPLVSLPQCGVLGMHAIQDRPVALAGQVVIRPMMYVALTYDHRLVDGREAVQFLKRVKELIESPGRMLIGI